MIDLPGIGRAGKGGNPPADALDIGSTRASLRSTEFRNDFRMLLGGFLNVALVEIADALLRLRLRNRRCCDRRYCGKQANSSTHDKHHPQFFV